LIGLFCITFVDYVKQYQANKYVDWDVKTITAGDYTVEFGIDDQAYDMFLNKFYDPSNPLSEIS
jgi:hypothetical protein